MASGLRPEFEEALKLLGIASRDLKQRGIAPPIVVGGAAVEFYTGSIVTTGDFDLVAADQASVEAALVKVGFQRENRTARILRGLYHPRLNMGVEIVSGRLYDGRAGRTKVNEIEFDPRTIVSLASIEDLIADRLGQFVSAPKGVPEMLRQAIMLYRTAGSIDSVYLDKRISEETSGEWSLPKLESNL